MQKKVARAVQVLADLPTLRVGESAEGFEVAKAFLARFGYLAVPDATTLESARAQAAESSPTLDGNTSDALRRYQALHALPQTGTFDAATREMMTRPRCGLPDINPATSVAFSIECRWNRRRLTFAFGAGTNDVPADGERDAVRRAFSTWAAAVPLTFTEIAADANPDILIAWTPANCGDTSMAGGTFAHADYPPGCGVFGNTLPRPVHFDNEEHTWRLGAAPNQYDVETTALHEIGHLLGLAHSGDPGAVMFAAGQANFIHRELAPDDLEGIRDLYPDTPTGDRDRGGRRVFARDLVRNTKSLYLVTSDGRLAQIWDDIAGWQLDFPAEAASELPLRFQKTPAVFGRDVVRNTKSMYVVTDQGRLAQIWDHGGWNLNFPAEAAGHGQLTFQGSAAVFGRDLARNTKSIYIVTTDGRLVQAWDDFAGWHLDFPAEAAGYSGRFQDSVAVFARDAENNTKSLYAITADGRLAQVWDHNGWHLDFPAGGLRFSGSPAVIGRDLARNTKSIYALTTEGRLAQMWDDDNGWHLDFPADSSGLRFQGSPAVFARDAGRNTKTIYLVTTDGRLAQLWDDNGWHLDFPADAAGFGSLRFQESPAVFGRSFARNTKSIYVVTTDGRLSQLWDDNGWHLDFPAEAAGFGALRFTGSV
jgi:hypothetical protein